MTRERERGSVAEPPSPERLATFPVWHVHAGTTMCRVTRNDRGPWWFASDGGGRFDLPSPRGTCYLADDPLVALLESLGPVTTVTPGWFRVRRLWQVPLPDQCDAADVTVRKARSFGVTAELATMTPYNLPQRWAVAFAAAGLAGIRYRARHDPAGGRALALFGATGERTRWRKGRPQPIDADLQARLARESGVVIAEIPDSDSLELRD